MNKNFDYTIVNAQSTFADIADVTEKLAVALEGVRPSTAIIGMLALCATSQKPDLTEDEIIQVVQKTSQYMCLMLTEGETQ